MLFAWDQSYSGSALSLALLAAHEGDRAKQAVPSRTRLVGSGETAGGTGSVIKIWAAFAGGLAAIYGNERNVIPVVAGGLVEASLMAVAARPWKLSRMRRRRCKWDSKN